MSYGDSTCVDAFHACNADAGCRLRFAAFLSACAWNRQTNKCKRQQCLDAIQRYYLLVRPEHTHALLFCRCQPDNKKCESVRQSMHPTCSKVEAPPPSCLAILERCKADTDCRIRLKAYDKHCGFGDNECGGTPTQCRNAWVGIMGTILTTNCTCTQSDADENRKCVHAHARFEKNNKCTAAAVADFHERYATVEDAPAVWSKDGIVSSHRLSCRSRMAENIPAYLDVPTVIRKYSNDSDCSSVCYCLNNGTLYCRRIQCNVNLSCKHRQIVYAHGMSFHDSDRGECRCIKGELVCAKSSQQLRRKPGLFLHVGYSIADQYLVEGHSGLSFQPWDVADKLAALINGDSAEQDCTTAAKSLSYSINSRSIIILTDAELSILKVSQLERIKFHRPPPPQISPPSRARSSGHGLRSPITTLLSLTLFCYPAILMQIPFVEVS
ncbi:hypothetical protein NP493_144g02022 [Ridgeia piscesae]|uniref:GDNF/GAS1 domain-containing protein n=1 Tax=Ridgeia piscesae TaxID=27915 RepID=A0AAD9P4X5_RIDPI|nr:hypothetical protein NP493_144g02022 [Ridgeia piscesae]